MVLSPIDIEQKTFRVALRGYAEEEVDQFLDEIVIAIREYERQMRDANERVAVLEEQLEANRETEERIKKTLIIAQRTADQVVEEARGEAKQLLVEARTQASDVELERIRERESLVADLDRMRSSVGSLKERVAALVESTMGKLDELEQDVVAAQPETDAVDQPADDFHDQDDFEEDAGDGLDAETYEEAEAESGDHVDLDVDEDEVEEEVLDDQREESTGQVFLGSGHRPWDRGGSSD
ncbi:MAG: DivIVA domain-containing protein [Acidimicrobiia bacterium]